MRKSRITGPWVLAVLVCLVFPSCGSPANEQATVPTAGGQATDSLRLHVTEQDRTDIHGREGYNLDIKKELADTVTGTP